MSGHVPQQEGEEPERPESGPESSAESGDLHGEIAGDGPAAHDDDADNGDLDVTRLPSVLRESAWSRMEEREALDHWVPPPPYVPRFAASHRRVLAGRLAVVVAAAVVGGIVGALLVAGPSRDPAAPDASEAVEALRGSIGQLASEVRSLKEGLGAGSQATAAGLAAIEERIAGAESIQADLSARIAGLAELRTPAQPPAPGADVSMEVTGSIAPAPVPIAHDWILWRVRNGRALVQGAPGYFEVETGSALPGLGIIQRIVKEDGRWMVYTPQAVIVSRG